MLSSGQRLIPMNIISRIPTQIHTETPITLGKWATFFGEVTRRRKRRNIVEPWSDSGDLDENIRTMLYPGERRHIDLLNVLVRNNDPAHWWHCCNVTTFAVTLILAKP